nr:helix-turn-helix transcriptional regulator [Mesorhizobium sp. WSM4875]
MAIPYPGNDEIAGCFKQPTAPLSMRNVHYSVSHHSARRSIRWLMKLRGVFGLNVQRLRRERKLSQEQLSFVSGRTRAYISSVEAGRRNATLDTVEILARALNVEPQELVSANPANKRAIRVTKPAASKSAD